jgi:hypothetical protein
MACMNMLAPGQTLIERMAQVEEALARLRASLTSGRVRVAIGPRGEVSFSGWEDRDGVNDACAYRALAVANSWELRQAVARAEAQSGRKVNAHAVASGAHSHDGGKTWHKGH